MKGGLFCEAVCNMQDTEAFSSPNRCMSHLFQVFNASSSPRGSVCITRWEVARREQGKFFMLSSKFRTNHGEADFYLHTFPPSNCAMRPFSLNGAWAEFKANPVQRKSDLIFTVKSKCDHAKVILVSTTPFEMLKKASFRIPKDTFQSIKKDFTPLVLWLPPISFFFFSK